MPQMEHPVIVVLGTVGNSTGTVGDTHHEFGIKTSAPVCDYTTESNVRCVFSFGEYIQSLISLGVHLMVQQTVGNELKL